MAFRYLFLFLLLTTLHLSAQEINREPTLRQKAAQMLMVGFRDTVVDENSEVINWIEKDGIGGVILYEYDNPSKSRPRNITSARQIKSLTDSLQTHAKILLFIGIDEEGGKVSRLKTRYGFLPSVSASYLGQLDQEDSTRFYASRLAANCRQSGVNLNFAPDVDVDVNPLCPVIGKLDRSFSANPMLVAKHAGWVVEEHQKQKVWCSLKHFPGHGSAKSDSHLGFTDVTDTWDPMELTPYRLLIAANRCPMVMTSHVFNRNIDSVFPATLSKPTLSLLRDSLNYNGLILSDDMMMGAITQHFGLDLAIEKAINAGVDVLLFSNNIDFFDHEIVTKAINAIIHLEETGKIPPGRIDESYRRILNYKNEINN
jgi:beta-N-acetylhexosaminidase